MEIKVAQEAVWLVYHELFFCFVLFCFFPFLKLCFKDKNNKPNSVTVFFKFYLLYYWASPLCTTNFHKIWFCRLKTFKWSVYSAQLGLECGSCYNNLCSVTQNPHRKQMNLGETLSLCLHISSVLQATVLLSVLILRCIGSMCVSSILAVLRNEVQIDSPICKRLVSDAVGEFFFSPPPLCDLLEL